MSLARLLKDNPATLQPPIDFGIVIENTGWETVPMFSRDPRPDLDRDSHLWMRMFSTGWEVGGQELAGILHGMRCLGMQIVWDGKRYMFQPTLDPMGRRGWVNQDAYNVDRQEWLMPQAELLKQVMARFTELVGKPGK